MADGDSSSFSFGGISMETPLGPRPSVALCTDVGCLPLRLLNDDDDDDGRCFFKPFFCSRSFCDSMKMSTSLAACVGMTATPARIDPATIKRPCAVIGVICLFFFYIKMQETNE